MKERRLKLKTSIKHKISIFCLLFSALIMINSSLASFLDVNKFTAFTIGGSVSIDINSLGINNNYITDSSSKTLTHENIKVGDVVTFSFNVVNTGNSVVKINPILKIAWDNEKDLKEEGFIYLYSESMTDEEIINDIINNESSSAIIGKNSDDSTEITLNNNSKRYGFLIELDEMFLDSSKEMGQKLENNGGLSSYTYTYKIAYAPSPNTGQLLSDFEVLEGENIHIDIEAQASLLNDASYWKSSKEASIILENAHLDLNSRVFDLYDFTPLTIEFTSANVVINVGDNFSVLEGVKAYDTVLRNSERVDLTSRITTESNVDPSTPGTYQVTYKVKDDANYETTRIREVKVVSNSINIEIPSNMIPVMYNGTNWVKADITNNDKKYLWYDYDEGLWANAVTVKEDVRTEYLNSLKGTVIDLDKITTMFVYIPRYRYHFPSRVSDEPSSINIVFETIKTPKSMGDGVSSYLTHPAFTFNNQELDGIWVGKFETSIDSDLLKIKPNETPLNNIDLGTAFNKIRNMQSINNPYGFKLNDTTNLHLSTSLEFSLVSYLSQSIYGKYGNNAYVTSLKEIFNNNNSSYKTGCSSGGVNIESSPNCTYSYEVFKGGTGASTTGNITGIYDISGGLEEAVMGVFNNSLGNSNFLSLPNNYYDNYEKNYKLGSITSEATGFYNQYNSFIDTTNSFLTFGGGVDNTKKSGAFSYSSYDGSAKDNVGFRVVLTALKDIDSPEITLEGDLVIEMNVGGIFTEPGYSAVDKADGDLTSKVLTSGNIDPSKEGIYTLTYNVSDDASNKAEEKTRTIKVINELEFVSKKIKERYQKNELDSTTYPLIKSEDYVGNYVKLKPTELKELGISTTKEYYVNYQDKVVYDIEGTTLNDITYHTLEEYQMIKKVLLLNNPEELYRFKLIIDGKYNEYSFLKDNQLDSGVIMSYKYLSWFTDNKVTPYFSNVGTKYALSDIGSLKMVKDYLKWYFAHINLNQELVEGTSFIANKGSIYDYKYDCTSGECIESIFNKSDPFDSVDAYSSTFLDLIKEYVLITGDYDFIKSNKDKVLLQANALDEMYDDALKLTKTKDNLAIYYLMNNCESYNGYKNLAWIYANVFNDNTNYNKYIKRANDLKESINNTLYSNTGGFNFYRFHYDSTADENYQRLFLQNLGGGYYPDVLGQLYPIIHEILDNTDNRILSVAGIYTIHDVYSRYNSYEWWTFKHPDNNNTTTYPHVESLVASLKLKEGTVIGTTSVDYQIELGIKNLATMCKNKHNNTLGVLEPWNAYESGRAIQALNMYIERYYK